MLLLTLLWKSRHEHGQLDSPVLEFVTFTGRDTELTIDKHIRNSKEHITNLVTGVSRLLVLVGKGKGKRGFL